MSDRRPGGDTPDAEHIRRDYAPLAAEYERRWRRFNASTRAWILARWPTAASQTGAVADLGCGAGGFLSALAGRHPGLDLFGLDITPALLARARAAAPSARLVLGDVAALPFAERSFDVVCSLNVLHHLKDSPAHIADLARLVRPGGSVFLSTFAGGRTILMHLADWWLKRRNPAWRGTVTPSAMAGLLAREPKLSIADQTQIKADGWWWLQLYRLEAAEGP